MARKTKEESERTYRALLHAAVDLFARHGIVETTLTQIAEQAGVTRGAFYWHFRDKSDVVRAIWETYAKPGFEALDQQTEDLHTGNPLDNLRNFTSLLLKEIIQNEQMGQAFRIVMHNVELSEQHSALLGYLVGEHADMIQSFENEFQKIKEAGLLRTDVSVKVISWGYISLLNGMIDKHFIPGTPDMIASHGMKIMDLYLDGVIAIQADT